MDENKPQLQPQPALQSGPTPPETVHPTKPSVLPASSPEPVSPGLSSPSAPDPVAPAPSPDRPRRSYRKLALIIAGFGLLFVASILLATMYSDRKKVAVNPNAPVLDAKKVTQEIQTGLGRSGQRGISGRVAAVSPSSITLENANNGVVMTMAVTQSTVVTTEAGTADLAVIKAGDSVLLYPDASAPGTAGEIVVNPQRLGEQYGNSAMPIR